MFTNHSENVRVRENSIGGSIVSVVLLNYNGSRYLERLFLSLNDQSLSAFEIVFVDNASSDDSVAIVEGLRSKLREGLTVKIIENDRNYGYCRGNNIGASAAEDETKYLVFLNNDTYVDADWLLNLVQKAESNNRLGAVGSKIEAAGGVAIIALVCDVYGQTDSIISQAADEQKRDFTNLKFFYCSGASLLVPKNVFWKVGGFDEALFMYHDDLDLCWKIRLSGYEVSVEPSSVCHHATDSSAYGVNLPVWKFYHGIVKNRIRVLLKNYAPNSILKYFPRALVLIALRGLLSSLANKNVQYLVALCIGLFWNVKNLKDTQLKRLEIQQLRNVPDRSILANMLLHSIEIAHSKRYLALI